MRAMKKTLWMLGVSILLTVSCNHSDKASQQTENATTDSLEVARRDTASTTETKPNEEVKQENKEKIVACKAFLEKFYQDLDDNGIDNAFVSKHITSNAAQYLKDAYDYDCMDDYCMASWLFVYNTTADKGDLKERTIEAIDENTYKVTNHYINTAYGDYLYAVQLSLVPDGDSFKIDDIDIVLNSFPDSPEEP